MLAQAKLEVFGFVAKTEFFEYDGGFPVYVVTVLVSNATIGDGRSGELTIRWGYEH